MCLTSTPLSWQSTEALEFMKRDLAEFSHVVQHDTACTIAATANAVKEKLSVSIRHSVTEQLGTIQDLQITEISFLLILG